MTNEASTSTQAAAVAAPSAPVAPEKSSKKAIILGMLPLCHHHSAQEVYAGSRTRWKDTWLGCSFALRRAPYVPYHVSGLPIIASKALISG